MNFDVGSEVVLAVELLVAHGTFELLLRRDVDLDMPLEMFQPLEALGANLADKFLRTFFVRRRGLFAGSFPQRFRRFVLMLGVLVEACLPHKLFVAKCAMEFLRRVFTLLSQVPHE